MIRKQVNKEVRSEGRREGGLIRGEWVLIKRGKDCRTEGNFAQHTQRRRLFTFVKVAFFCVWFSVLFPFIDLSYF